MLRTISPPNVPTGLPSAAEISGVLDRLDRFFNGEKAIRQFFAGFKSVLEECELDLRKFGTLEKIEQDAVRMNERVAEANLKRVAAEEALIETRKNIAAMMAKAQTEADAMRAEIMAKSKEWEALYSSLEAKNTARETLLTEREAALAKAETGVSDRHQAAERREAAVKRQIEKMAAAGIKIEL